MNEFEKRINLNFPLEILSQEVCKQYNLGDFVDNQLIKININCILKKNSVL